MAAITRSALGAALRAALEHCPDVLCAWEGGSTAFGSDDGLSDIDAIAVVEDDAVDAAFAAVEAGLERLAPIALAYRVPGTAGYAQRFYRLEGAPEHLVVDLAFIRRSDPLMFREVELHGEGVVWFDRAELLDERHVDAEQDLQAARVRVPQLRAHFDMFQHVPTKERLRGRAVEALHFYQQMSLRPLVEALRLLHDPQRRMFSIRYLARDLPPDVCRRIERLSFVHDLGDLAVKHGEVQRWFWSCIERLERLGPGSGFPEG